MEIQGAGCQKETGQGHKSPGSETLLPTPLENSGENLSPGERRRDEGPTQTTGASSHKPCTESRLSPDDPHGHCTIQGERVCGRRAAQTHSWTEVTAGSDAPGRRGTGSRPRPPLVTNQRGPGSERRPLRDWNPQTPRLKRGSPAPKSPLPTSAPASPHPRAHSPSLGARGPPDAAHACPPPPGADPGAQRLPHTHPTLRPASSRAARTPEDTWAVHDFRARCPTHLLQRRP